MANMAHVIEIVAKQMDQINDNRAKVTLNLPIQYHRYAFIHVYVKSVLENNEWLLLSQTDTQTHTSCQ